MRERTAIQLPANTTEVGRAFMGWTQLALLFMEYTDVPKLVRWK